MSRSTEARIAIDSGLADVGGELAAERAEAQASYEAFIQEVAEQAEADFWANYDDVYDPNPYDDHGLYF